MKKFTQEQIDLLEQERNSRSEDASYEVTIIVQVDEDSREINCIYKNGEIRGMDEISMILEKLVEEMI